MDKEERQRRKEYCEENGHSFGEWKEKTWVEYKEYEGPWEPYLGKPEGSYVERTKWTRRCKCCGCVQTTSVEPKENEIEEIEKEIKRLNKRLSFLKK